MEEKKIIEKSREFGYKGDSETEAANWMKAVDKGLDMSDEARYERAEKMGFSTKTVYHHGTANYFDKFDKKEIGKNYHESEDSGFFFTKNKRQAERYASLHSNDGEGRVISAFLYSKNPIELSTNSDYYAPADRFDLSGHDLMHDARIQENDSILIKGTRNDDLLVVFEPNQILSIFASFDPETESYDKKVLMENNNCKIKEKKKKTTSKNKLR